MSNETMTTNQIRLFRVDNEGAVYWIIGDEGTPAEMQAAIEEIECVTFESEGWRALEADDVREVSEAEAREIACRDEDEITDMWTAAQEHVRTGRGRVVACSEWN